MPDARISELPAATAPNDTDLSALVQPNAGGLETRKATVSQLRAAVLSGRAAHVRDYGAVGDGTTNDAPAIQSAIDDLATKGGGTLMFGARRYRLASAITIGSAAITLQGQGFTEGPNAADGTWLLVDQTGFTPITFTGLASRGGGLRDIAFRQSHTAALNASWAPNNYDYLVRVNDCLGGIAFDNVFMANANRGIYCNNSGRLFVNRLRGQIFTAGIEIDNALDVPRLQNVHFWPFWSGDTNVIRYAQNTCDAIILRRVDGIFIDAAFVLPARSMFRLTSGTAGTASKVYIGTAYADFVKYAVLMEADGCDALIDSLTSHNEYFGASGAPQAGAIGVYVTASNTRLQIGKLRVDRAEDNAIRVEGTGNRLDIGALRCVVFNSRANNSAAVHLADSGASTPNACYIGAPPLIEGATGPLTNSGGNGIFGIGTVAGTASRPGLSLGTADTGLFAPATGAPALSAAGQEVLRGTSSGGVTLGGAPNAHAFEVATPLSTTNRVLVTGSATGAAVQMAAAGGDANIALQLSPKGTGALLGVTPASSDNSTALATTAYVRAQGYAPLAAPAFTGSLTLPSWTTAGRPNPATAGMVGWNTTLQRFDLCSTGGSPGTWRNLVRLDGDTMTGDLVLPGGTAAVRGTVTTFASSGTYTKKSQSTVVAVLAVGGGGGGGFGGSYNPGATGGSGGGGGGGAGYGYQLFRAADVPASVSVTVGAGGAGGTSGVTPTGGSIAGQGGRSGISSFGTLLYGGGGGGGAPGALGAASGGGGSCAFTNTQANFGTNAAGGAGSGGGTTGGFGAAGALGTTSPGAGGSGAGSGATGAGFAGGICTHGAAGGGSGGGFNASAVAQNGGNGGGSVIGGLLTGPSAGSANTGSAGNSGSAASPTSLGPYSPANGGAGGGAGSSTNGGAGGAGASGSGGGGGGAGDSSLGRTGGAGGAGGNGIVLVWEW